MGIGLLIALTILQRQVIAANILGILFLAVLGIIAESQGLAIDEDRAISIAFAIDISALLMFGLAPAAWVSFCTAFFSIVVNSEGKKQHLLNTPLYKSLLNAANYVLSILACGWIYEIWGGRFLITVEATDIQSVLLQLVSEPLAFLAGLILYVLVNTILIMIYFATVLDTRHGLLKEWFAIFRWSIISMICIGSLGVFLTAVYRSFGFLAVLLFFAPFMMFRYAYVGFTSVRKGYVDTIKAFSTALEAKDQYTIGHSRRVSHYCEMIAEEMRLSSEQIRTLKYASLLHDIGKIGINENILNKKGRLNAEEYQEIQKHPVIGAQMLENVQFLKKEVRIIRAHHVHYDGTGYPANAYEESRLLETQILCVADSFDAMTSDRAYRTAMSLEEAIDELNRFSGTQFAPRVVESFVRCLNRLENDQQFNELRPMIPGAAVLGLIFGLLRKRPFQIRNGQVYRRYARLVSVFYL